MALEMQVVREQLQNVIAQRDNAAKTFEQCVGAIALLSEQLKMLCLQEEMQKQEAQALADKEADINHAATMDSMPCEGDAENGEVKQQEPLETA